MPELPEVETVARQLDPLIRGRDFRALEIYDDLLVPGCAPAGGGLQVLGASRVAKQVVLQLAQPGKDTPCAWIGVHLRMTGRLAWAPERPRAVPHLRARLVLAGGDLLFVDTRRFGTLRWLSHPEDGAPGGLEPLSRAHTPARLRQLLAGSGQELKPWLLRQDRLVGLGNIYASEIPHEARLSPFRKAGTLTGDEILRLHGAIRAVLRRAIRNCGTTFSDFQDAYGVTGSYQSMLKVYGRGGESCPRCGGEIRRVVQQQRSTYFCSREFRAPPARLSS
jgi:formamidopyrimidine-DNA glycosylase